MKNLCLILLLFAIPVFAYEVFMPNEYKYKSDGDKLLFVIDFSNSMSEYLEGKTKVNTTPIDFELPKLNEIPELKNSDPVMEIL